MGIYGAGADRSSVYVFGYRGGEAWLGYDEGLRWSSCWW